MTRNGRALAESLAAAVSVWIAAALLEAAVIRAGWPTEWQLAWVGDMVLALAFATAVYLWRSLHMTRRALEDRERAELVLQTQLSLAAEIQTQLLPAIPPSALGFEWAAALRPAGKIGGDYYDFVEVAPARWIALVADVSGRGISAAMALGSLRAAFRTLAAQTADPARIVAPLSAALFEEWHGALYVTCIVATFDLKARMLAYTNAGHPPGIVSGPHGTRHLTRGGPPAGLFPDAQFEQERVWLRPGDACLLVSDGVTEALDGQTPLERDLLAPGPHDRPSTAAEICRAVMLRALEGGGPLGDLHWDDDRTVVVVTVGESTAAPAALTTTTSSAPAESRA